MVQVSTYAPFKKSVMRGVFDTKAQAIKELRKVYPYLKQEGVDTYSNIDRKNEIITFVEIRPYTIGTLV